MACLGDPPRVLISDLCVPGSIGSRELARYVRNAFRETKVVFITGYDSDEIILGAPDLEDVECYAKPIDFDALITSLKAPTASSNESQHSSPCGV